MFGWFMSAAKKRGMSVSLSDYTLGVGQGSYVDEMLEENSDLNGYELRSDKKELLRGDVSLLEFDSRKITDSRVCFTFKSAPGLEAMEFTAFGLEPEVYAGNMECRIEKVCARGDGAAWYRKSFKLDSLPDGRAMIDLGDV